MELEEFGQPRQNATSRFDFALSTQDAEDLRWYFEDFLEFPSDPAPQIANRIERRVAEVGRELFRAAFASDDARHLWGSVRRRLAETRVEVDASLTASYLPWELMRDPKLESPVSVQAASFVRIHRSAVQRPLPPSKRDGPVRIALVICRPRGAADVPFRSVASRLIRGLADRHREDFTLEVLRPPTFGRLDEVLMRAAHEQDPYDIVHFDGHGVYRTQVDGTGRGYLLFESGSDRPFDPVDGTRLGGLLVKTGVPVLVLNACRSAHLDPPPAPVADDGASPHHPHERVRAYGSLAFEAMDAGATGVVAMQYNVYDVTAARFVGDLYATLARGQTLGRAVALGRKQLHAEPVREVASVQIDFQDWPVPVVYEAAPVALFPEDPDVPLIRIELDHSPGTREPGTVDAELLRAPDLGFFGRDETLLALDRAFDENTIVLLHGYAGSGKTATAAEFARWYSTTSGVSGPVLFTSFEQYAPLASVLDTFERGFRSFLEADDVEWPRSSAERRELSLNVLSQVAALWIWDNVETVTGFPTGTESLWTEAEQEELADFLRDLRSTYCRALLTSRREEDSWLQELPARVPVPPMPMQERVQMAQALALRRRRKLVPLAPWRPLLEFTQGNPLTTIVVVSEALKQGSNSPEQIERFVADLRSGLANLDEDSSEGRSASLTASLDYGFQHGFDEQERARLALLHLFQGVVTPELLTSAIEGVPLPEIGETMLAEAQVLLLRAADSGLLMSMPGRAYAIHPALPTYLRNLFEQHHPGEAGERATRDFVTALAGLAVWALAHNSAPGTPAIVSLAEPDILQALRFARKGGWATPRIQLVQALGLLYERRGRWSEFARLIAETVPDFTDPRTDGPLPGCELLWHLVTEQRVRLAFQRRDFDEAMRLQQLIVDRLRDETSDGDRSAAEDIRGARVATLSVALNELGLAQLDRGLPEAAKSLWEAVRTAHHAHAPELEWAARLHLAQAYLRIETIRSLDRAEKLLCRGLKLVPEWDTFPQSFFYAELASVSRERALSAFDSGDEARAVELAQASIDLHTQAIDLTPSDAVDVLATRHADVGSVYAMIGAGVMAVDHWSEAVRFAERSRNWYVAGHVRWRVAEQRRKEGRLGDALLWARAAITDLEKPGGQTNGLTAEVRCFIAELQGNA